MSAWITDRVPTIKDADRYGGVMVTISGQVLQWDWAEVKTGTPWQPITYPEPYVKPKKYSWELAPSDVNYIIRDNTDGSYFYTGTVYDISKTHIQAMTDALNRLEEGV